MKKNMKRCTNSNCRRMFVSNNVCPYCGKQYPRVSPAAAEYEVALTRTYPKSIKGLMNGRKILGAEYLKLYNGPVPVGRFSNIGAAQVRADELNQLKGLRADIRRLR